VHAVISVVAVSLSYSVLGLLGWAWHARAGVVACLALLLCMAMEFGKLFTEATRPDPTNLGVAMAAAWVAQQVLLRLSRPAAPVAPPTNGR